jgi:hypothetical protein
VRAFAFLALAACSANDDIPDPRIGSINPSHAPVGASVTIEGEYFCQQLENEDPLACANIGSVSFGTLGATTITYGDERIIVEVPSGTGLVRVRVSSAGQTSNAVDFTIE